MMPQQFFTKLPCGLIVYQGQDGAYALSLKDIFHAGV